MTWTLLVRAYDRYGDGPGTVVDYSSLDWSADLGGGAQGSMRVNLAAPALGGDPRALDDRLVRLVLADGQGTEHVIGGALTGVASGTLVGDGGDMARELEIPLLPLTAWLHDWVVYPRGSLSWANIDQRSMGWTDDSYDTSGSPWTSAQGKAYALQNVHNEALPAGWPDRTAQWIAYGDPAATGIPGGTIDYLQKVFTTSQTIPVQLYATGDDRCTVYLDGTAVLECEEWRQAYVWQGILPAGTHTVAMRVENGEASSPAYNQINGILTMFDTSSGTRGAVVVHSDSTWRAYRGEEPPPGQTAAEIFLRLLSEAAQRGVTSAGRMAPTFNGATDSQGVPWPDLQERSWQIGTPGDQVVEDLGELAFDLEITPSFSIDAFIEKGEGRPWVHLAAGHTLLTYTWQGHLPVSTRLLVRSGAGWVEVADAGVEGALGRREGALESGLSDTTSQAAQVAQQVLATDGTYRRVFEATFLPDASLPFVDWEVGDRITAPGWDGQDTTCRVLSLGVSDSEEGLRFTTQIEEVLT